MKCPKCHTKDTKVVDSRVVDPWTSIKRRRSCEHCLHRFTTYEHIAVTDLIVLKRDGSKELYDRAKLKRSLLIGFGKKNLLLDTIEEIIWHLEVQRSWSWKEITSKKIWQDVLAQLKEINDVAYIRFASVFMEFETKEDFQTILRE